MKKQNHPGSVCSCQQKVKRKLKSGQKNTLRQKPKGAFQKVGLHSSHFLQPVRSRICSSKFLVLTVVQGGMDLVINTLEPMTQFLPITVSPPKTDAPA